MARKQRRPGQGPKEQQPQQNPQPGSGGGGASWAPLRDAIRRDVEQAVAALAFAERLHAKLETQRRAFLDFPRVLEQIRSGALERLTASLSRLYEGGQGFDLQRFLRDLPLALAQLAAAERKQAQSSQPPPAQSSQPPLAQSSQPPPEASQPPASEGAQPPANEQGSPPPPAESGQAAAQPAAENASQPGGDNAQAGSQPPAQNAQGSRGAPSEASPALAEEPSKPSPRLELRAKMLAAAPNLAKAAQGYRRNVATIRRAATPRRSPGPWRADREVLEEAGRAVEFVQKLYDTYAEAWADQPLPPNLHEEAAAETDRFLAWTQLDRYVELAVAARSTTQKPGKPGQQVISAPAETPQPVTEASPSAVIQSEAQGEGQSTQAPEGGAAAQPSQDAPAVEQVDSATQDPAKG